MLAETSRLEWYLTVGMIRERSDGVCRRCSFQLSPVALCWWLEIVQWHRSLEVIVEHDVGGLALAVRIS